MDIHSFMVSDLVLYYDLTTGKFYLHDSYPDNLSGGTMGDLVLKNKEKRAAGWDKFVNQLKAEKRLK